MQGLVATVQVLAGASVLISAAVANGREGLVATVQVLAGASVLILAAVANGREGRMSVRFNKD
jgi:hypothetical protein